MEIYDAYKIDNLIPLDDEDYEIFLKHAIHNAIKRIWVCMFIIDCYPFDDQNLKVRKLLKLLARKKNSHVDVRVLTDMASNTETIHNSNKLAYMLMKFYGIKCRFYSGEEKSLHSKYVLIDDELCILGSHNSTDGAFSKHRESSVAVISRELNIKLSIHFLREWENSYKSAIKKINMSEKKDSPIGEDFR
jgi:cardiolipin synthase